MMSKIFINLFIIFIKININDYGYYTLIIFILIYILQLNDILVFIHNRKVVFVHVNVGLETAGRCSCKIELVLVTEGEPVKKEKRRDRNT